MSENNSYPKRKAYSERIMEDPINFMKQRLCDQEKFLETIELFYYLCDKNIVIAKIILIQTIIESQNFGSKGIEEAPIIIEELKKYSG